MGDAEVRQVLAMALRGGGHEVVDAADGPGLLFRLARAYEAGHRRGAASAVVADVRLWGCDGLSILRSMRRYPWCPPFILMSAVADPRLVAEARTLGACALIEGPVGAQELLAFVDRI